MMLVQCKVHLCNPVKVLWVNREVKFKDRVKVEEGMHDACSTRPKLLRARQFRKSFGG